MISGTRWSYRQFDCTCNVVLIHNLFQPIPVLSLDNMHSHHWTFNKNLFFCAHVRAVWGYCISMWSSMIHRDENKNTHLYWTQNKGFHLKQNVFKVQCLQCMKHYCYQYNHDTLLSSTQPTIKRPCEIQLCVYHMLRFDQSWRKEGSCHSMLCLCRKYCSYQNVFTMDFYQ